MRVTILSAITALLWLQAPAQQLRPASIEGIVVSLGSGIPIAGAQVKLTIVAGTSGSGSGDTVVLTEVDGKFAFRSVNPGSTYRLSFARNGYVRKEYGQRTASGSGTTFRLGEGQAIKDFVVSLTPTGSVEGRITDDRRQPLEGIQVRLMRQSYNAEGEMNLQAVGTTRTNDRGDYRLYWVNPGRYYVTAETQRGQGDPVSTNIIETTGYIGSYYPGTAESSKAAAIDVNSGVNVSGIDWSLFPARGESQSFHVRGRVIDSRTGQSPRTNVSISVSRRVGTGSATNSSTSYYSAASGTFDMPGVAPGTYWLGAATTGTDQRSDQTQIVISDRDIDGITLTMIPGVTINGRIRTEGSSLSKSDSDRIRASLAWVGARLPFSSNEIDLLGSQVKPDGTFIQYRLPPGPYKVSVSPLPPDYYIKSALLGQTDVLGQTVQITGPVEGTLDVVISDKSGLIEGTVVDARRQPVANIEAVLIPDTHRNRVDLYKKATTDAAGHFSIRGIPPGNYRLFAWEILEPYAYFDPQVVLQAEPLGRPVRVGESSKEVVEVRSIP